MKKYVCLTCEWVYDEEKGYQTTSYLGRIARTSSALSDEENEAETERAIDEIIQYNHQYHQKNQCVVLQQS